MFVSGVIVIPCQPIRRPQRPRFRRGSHPSSSCPPSKPKKAVDRTPGPFCCSGASHQAIRQLVQFNLLSRLNAKMLQHILAEGDLSPCGYRQSGHGPILAFPMKSVMQNCIIGNKGARRAVPQFEPSILISIGHPRASISCSRSKRSAAIWRASDPISAYQTFDAVWNIDRVVRSWHLVPPNLVPRT